MEGLTPNKYVLLSNIDGYILMGDLDALYS